MAFAGLGAAEVLRPPRATRRPALLADAAATTAPPRDRATVALAAAAPDLRQRGPRRGRHRAAGACTTSALLTHGLRMLAWLRDVQTARRAAVGHTGRRAGTRAMRCRHDQQPIEVAALADACATAATVTGDPGWGGRAAGASGGSSATTTSARRCGIRRPAAATTG